MASGNGRGSASGFAAALLTLICIMALPGVATAATAGPVGPDGSLLDSTDLEALDRAEDAGQSHVTLLIAAEEDRTAAVAAGIRALGGTIGFRENRVDYVRARVPLEKAKEAARLSAIEAIDVDRKVYLDDPIPHGSSPASPQTPPTAATPRTNPYMPLQDTGADAFGAVPERDGRGVTVAILDTGIDLAHEALQTTTTSNPKVIDWVNAIPPNNGDSSWVATNGRHNGSFSAAGATWVAPATGGPFAFGTLVEDRGDLAGGEVGGDLNRNGVIGETFGVIQDRTTNEVIVDANMNRDFTDDQVLSDFRVDREHGFLGTDDPGTPIEERMAYTVDTRRSSYVPDVNAGSWVNVGIAGNSHGTHVAGITAAYGMFGGSMEGNAPGAQLISVKVCPASGGCSGTAMTEGMLYAAQHGADLANMSVGGMRVFNDGNDATSEIYNRIVEDFGMTIFTSAGNDGPGVNTVGHPAVSGKTIGVAASVNRATWLSNYGQAIDAENALFTFSSRGPGLDGGFKPEITAPGAAVSSIPPWQPGLAIDGIYSLPPGYGMQNGTSMSSPQAAGAAALLVGAYLEEFGERPSPEDLRRALVSSANPIPGAPANGQGPGLIDIPAAWDLLRATGTVQRSTIEVKAPVDNVLSSGLADPGFGAGIYDREGVRPGQRITRTVKLTRSSGPAGTRVFNLTKQGDLDITFPATVSLPLGVPVEFQAEIEVGEAGIDSATIRVDDPGSVGVDHVIQNVVFATGRAEPRVSFEGTVPKGGDRSAVFRVPAGTSAFKVALKGGGTGAGQGQLRFRMMDPEGMPYESIGSRECFAPDTGSGCSAGSPTARMITDPKPGVWEVVIEAHRASSLQATPYEVTGSLLDVSISPDPDVVAYRGPGTIARRYEVANQGGSFVGRLAGGALAAAQEERLTIAEGEQIPREIEVPAGTEELTVAIGNPALGQSDLDLVLFDCRVTSPCTRIASSTSVNSEETVTVSDPPEGSYMALIQGYDVPGGATAYDYRAAYRNPSLGSLTVDDADGTRATGSTWDPEATVTIDRQPPTGWGLAGDLRVVDTDGDVIQRGKLRLEHDPDAPVVSITKAPPAKTDERSATFEFTVDDPQAESHCRLDGSDWAPCSSPHTVTGLAVGDHRFEVRAGDRAGFGEAAVSEFTVTEQPIPPGPVCPAVKLGISLRGFDAKPPYGKSRRAAGIRVRMKSRNVIARITPKIRYRVGGKARTVKLKQRTVRINGSRQLRFLAPKPMKRDYRKAGVRLKGSRVTFMLQAKARLSGTESDCDQKVKVKSLRTRVVGVSGRVALRRVGW